jgi:hypothetical protein
MPNASQNRALQLGCPNHQQVGIRCQLDIAEMDPAVGNLDNFILSKTSINYVCYANNG